MTTFYKKYQIQTQTYEQNKKQNLSKLEKIVNELNYLEQERLCEDLTKNEDYERIKTLKKKWYSRNSYMYT